MRILYVCNRFLPDIGGIANYIYRSVSFFPKEFKIYVYTLKTRQAMLMNEKIGNIYIRRFHAQCFLDLFVLSLTLVHQLIKDRRNFDVVNFQGIYRLNTLLAILLKLLGVKVVITTHGLALDTPLQSRILRLLKYVYDRVMIPLLALCCSRILVVSGPENQHLRNLGIHQSKISIVHLGANTCIPDRSGSLKDRYYIPSASSLIGCVSTFEKRKNLPHVLQLFSRLRKEDHNTFLIIVGPFTKEQMRYIHLLAQRLNVADRVIVASGLSDRDLTIIYQSLDVMVFPSRNEGFPLVLIEAASAGVPFVAYDTRSMRYVNSKLQCGLLAECENIRDLTNKVKEILSNSKLRTRLKERGRNASMKFSWKHTAELLINIYEEAKKSR